MIEKSELVPGVVVRSEMGNEYRLLSVIPGGWSVVLTKVVTKRGANTSGIMDVPLDWEIVKVVHDFSDPYLVVKNQCGPSMEKPAALCRRCGSFNDEHKECIEIPFTEVRHRYELFTEARRLVPLFFRPRPAPLFTTTHRPFMHQLAGAGIFRLR